MDRGHAVGAVRADDSEVGHPDFALTLLLDQADTLDAALVSGKADPDGIEKAPIDLVDDLQVARQKVCKPGKWPFLKRFGQQRVVGVGQRRCVMLQAWSQPSRASSSRMRISSGDGQRRMCIVELDGDFPGECAPIGVATPEAAHDIGQRAGDEEILLQEAQRLSASGRIVGIQDPRERVGREGSRPAHQRSRRC